MLLMAVLMKSNPILDLFGIMVGHLWHFLTEIVPQVSYCEWEVENLNLNPNLLPNPFT